MKSSQAIVPSTVSIELPAKEVRDHVLLAVNWNRKNGMSLNFCTALNYYSYGILKALYCYMHNVILRFQVVVITVSNKRLSIQFRP